MLYDIPARTGTPIEYDSLVRLAEHERILAVKDAKGDLFEGSRVMAGTDLAYYSGDDPLNLAWLTHGGTGVVSVVGHVHGDDYAAMVAAVDRGRPGRGAGDPPPADPVGARRHGPLVAGRDPGQGRPAAARRHPGAHGPAAAAARLRRRGRPPRATVASGPPGEPPAPRARAAARARRRRPARGGPRRPRRGRPQHDRLRVRRAAAGRRLRRAVPRGLPARRRPDPARLRLHPGPAGRRRGDRADPRATRTTSARCPTCCARSPTSRCSGPG